MASVRFEGPQGQVCREVGEATGEGDVLEPGRVYELPDELADQLVASSQQWQKVRSPRPKPAKDAEPVTSTETADV